MSGLTEALRSAAHLFRLQLRDEHHRGELRMAWFMARCGLVIHYPRLAWLFLPAHWKASRRALAAAGAPSEDA